MKKLLDLRFVIGAFFLIIGIILFIYSRATDSAFGNGKTINFWAGITFGLFGIIMILLSFGKDAHDEILEEKPGS